MAIQQLLAAYGAGGGGGGVGGDPFFANVVSLLHFDGTNGSTTFTDQIGKTWTSSNAANANLSTTDPRFGSACLLLNNGHISTPDSADWHFGAGDFTIEAWVRPVSATQTGSIVGQWDGGFSRSWILYQLNSDFRFDYSTDGGVATIAFSAAAGWSTTSYQHIAVSCAAGVIRGFVNGVQVGSNHTRVGALFNSTLPLLVGLNSAGVQQFNGRVDDLRITKGVGRYTANFTPPTAAFPDS